jgi:hypothetical protein
VECSPQLRMLIATDAGDGGEHGLAPGCLHPSGGAIGLHDAFIRSRTDRTCALCVGMIPHFPHQVIGVWVNDLTPMT